MDVAYRQALCSVNRTRTISGGSDVLREALEGDRNKDRTPVEVV
jgi:hypothetical protein